MNNPPLRTRRASLQFGAVVTASMLAGCAAVSDALSSPPTLGELYVENRDTTDGTIDVIVELDDDQVYASTHDIDGADDSGRHLEIEGEYVDHRTWEGLSGRFVVSASATGDEWHTVDLAEYGDADCYSLVIRRDREETIHVLTTPTCEPASSSNPYVDDSS